MKKISIHFVLLMVVSFLGTSCSQKSNAVENAISKNIDGATFKKMMEDGRLIAIDVRKPAERLSNNIFPDLKKPYGYITATQLNIDWKDQALFKAEMAKLDKSKAYGVYCRSGKRSANALAAMKDMGFEEVYNLLGGMKGWLKAGYPNTVVPK